MGQDESSVADEAWVAGADAMVADGLDDDDGEVEEHSSVSDEDSNEDDSAGDSDEDSSLDGDDNGNRALPQSNHVSSSSGNAVGDGNSSGTKSRRAMRRYFEEEDSSVTCRHCGGIGHFARDCVNEKMPKPCFLCGEKGHQARDCMNQQCFKCRMSGHKSSQCPNRPYLDSTCYRCGRSAGHSPFDCPHAVRFDGLISLPPPQAPDPLLRLAWSGVRGNKDYWNICDILSKKSRAPPRGKSVPPKTHARDQAAASAAKGGGVVGAGAGKRKRVEDLQPGDLDGDSVDEVIMCSDEDNEHGPANDLLDARGGAGRPSKRAKQVGLLDDEAGSSEEEQDEAAWLEEGEDAMGSGSGGADGAGSSKQRKKKKKKQKDAALVDADAFHRSRFANNAPGDEPYVGRRARQKMRQRGGGGAGAGSNAGGARRKSGFGFQSPQGGQAAWQGPQVVFTGGQAGGGQRGGAGKKLGRKGGRDFFGGNDYVPLGGGGGGRGGGRGGGGGGHGRGGGLRVVAGTFQKTMKKNSWGGGGVRGGGGWKGGAGRGGRGKGKWRGR